MTNKERDHVQMTFHDEHALRKVVAFNQTRKKREFINDSAALCSRWGERGGAEVEER